MSTSQYYKGRVFPNIYYNYGLITNKQANKAKNAYNHNVTTIKKDKDEEKTQRTNDSSFTGLIHLEIIPQHKLGDRSSIKYLLKIYVHCKTRYPTGNTIL